MDVQRFDFSFTYLKQEILASCQKMKVFRFPQYRVVINAKNNKKNPDIFILYEINEPGQKFFSYEFEGEKGGLAKAVATALEQKPSAVNKLEVALKPIHQL